jgi:dTDP-4-dehydrorhamnose reductase
MARVDYLVTGSRGQLGRAVLAAAAGRALDAVGLGHAELAVEDGDAVRAALERHRPTCVLHCGAFTNVDGCEREPSKAELLNGTGTANVAAACAAGDIGLIYVSTDFVFDGHASAPYAVDAATAPLSAYGRSKLHGEQAVLGHRRADFHVLRTSWVFGRGGSNFPRAILDRARSGQPLQVVTDQVGRPTLTDDLAEAMLDLWQRRPAGGIYHAANEGQCSWHEFAVAILGAAGLGHLPVGRITAAALGRPAARPAYSVLDTSRLAAVRGRSLPPWPDALRRYLKAEGL